MNTLDFKEWLLTENRHEKYAFHAIILSGGPGSGKTWIAENVFKHLGFNRIDSDEIIPLVVRKELKFQGINPREKAYKLAATKSKSWQSTGKPILIDITGRDVNNVNKIRNELANNGYDVYMVFINTPLQMAIERNKSRPRNEPEDFVLDAWKSAQKARSFYKDIFGPRYIEIQNNIQYSKDQYKDLNRMVYGWIRQAMSMFGDPFDVTNPIGKQKLNYFWKDIKTS